MKWPNLKKFGLAMWASLKELRNTGSAIVPEHVVQQRLEKCNDCPHFDPHFRQCEVCTCLVDVKTLLRTEECPKGKWSRWPKNPFDGAPKP